MAKAVAVANDNNEHLERLKSGPARLMDFLRDVRSEMRKVVTPSRAEVQSMTIVVVATVFIFAAYFWVIDSLLGQAITALLHHFGAH